jgi:hypothetical protein
MVKNLDLDPEYFRELRNNFLSSKYLISFMRIRIRDPESFESFVAFYR